MVQVADRQVYICFDGPDGLVIQTTERTFYSYYRWLGWEMIGPATELSLFGDSGGE